MNLFKVSHLFHNCRQLINVVTLHFLFSWSVGCRVQAGNPQSAKPKNPGQVTVALADAPVDDLSNLYITVEAIAFAPEGTGKCLSHPNLKCADVSLKYFELTNDLEVDLLSLSDGRTQVLPFSQQLESGTYEGLRLFLTEGSLVKGILKASGAEVEIAFPSGPFGRREFTLIEEFDVEEGTDNEILIHFDLRRSLQKTKIGSYMLIPFTHVVPSKIAARLNGGVSSPDVSRVCVYNVGGKRRIAKSGESQSKLQEPSFGLGGRRELERADLLSVRSVNRNRGFGRQPGQPDLTSSCDNAEGVSDVKEGRYDIRYLPPVSYLLRSFKSDGTYTDTSVSALRPQETRVLDL